MIIAIITIILVKGIRESATLQRRDGDDQARVVLFVIVVGAFYVEPARTGIRSRRIGWTASASSATPSRARPARAASRSACSPGRRSSSSRTSGSTRSRPTPRRRKNPQRDVPIGIIASLVICTILYIAVAAVLTGMVPYDQINIDAPGLRRVREGRAALGAVADHRVGARRRDHVRAAGHDAQPAARPPGDGARRPACRRASSAAIHPPVPDALEVDDPDRRLRGDAGRAFCRSDVLAELVNIGTLLGVRHRLRGRAHHAAHESQRRAAVPRAASCRSCRSWASHCLLLMFSLPAENWLRLFVWLGIGLVIYFGYGRHHSVMSQLNDAEFGSPRSCPRSIGI